MLLPGRSLSQIGLAGSSVRYFDITKFSVDQMEIPAINIEGLNGERRNETMALLHEACAEWGFFWVS